MGLFSSGIIIGQICNRNHPFRNQIVFANVGGTPCSRNMQVCVVCVLWGERNLIKNEDGSNPREKERCSYRNSFVCSANLHMLL